MQAQVYIVRIYRRNGETGLAGTVEVVRDREQRHFRNFEELRAILELAPEPRPHCNYASLREESDK